MMARAEGFNGGRVVDLVGEAVPATNVGGLGQYGPGASTVVHAADRAVRLSAGWTDRILEGAEAFAAEARRAELMLAEARVVALAADLARGRLIAEVRAAHPAWEVGTSYAYDRPADLWVPVPEAQR